MHFSSLLLGLAAALHTASAIPAPLDILNIGPLAELGFKFQNPECNIEDSNDKNWIEGHDIEIAKNLLASVNDPKHINDLSGRPAGTNDIFASGGLVVTGSRYSGTGKKGDSTWGELGCGLNWMFQNCMDPEGKRLALGCHPACGNDLYYICLRNSS